MSASEALEKVRQLRRRENIALKPSPYLRKSYVDEYGEERAVQIRNYQAQGIMNLLQVERMVLGDDTGLGKTLEMLSAIGYVWLKEPDYVPIIVTTKSSLFQWEAETKKFMQDMEAVTVSGEPYERHALYEEFFWRHDPSKKRLLIMTYDQLMRDMTAAVVRDRSQKPAAELKKELAAARRAKKAADEALVRALAAFEAHFNGRIFDVHEHVRSLSHAREAGGDLPAPPGAWTGEDQAAFDAHWAVRAAAKDAAAKVDLLNNEAAPPKQVPGISDYVRSLREEHPQARLMLVLDEMHKLKNYKSQFHDKAKTLSLECQRIYGMTATPVKNRLMEFFALYRIVKPDLFPKVTHFQNEFCVMKMQRIGGGRQVPIVVGYRNLDEFVRRVEFYYLSRKKYDVAKELPELVSREVECELTDLQEELYDMAEAGLLNKSDDPDASNAEMLSALTMCQQAVDSPQLIADEEGNPFDGPSCKVDELLDLIQGEAQDQKVIVFSKFERMISLVEAALKEAKVRCVRITGKESDARVRERNKNTFQDMGSGVDVVLITTAGSESINLHSAEHIVLLDLPWSYGDYLQLIGRAVRIGSVHKVVVAHHFLGRKRGGKSTIDHHVLKALRSKKKLADKVAGDSLKGGLSFVDGDTAQDVIAAIKAGRRAGGPGTQLARVNAQLKARGATARAPDPPDHEPVRTVDLDLSDL